VDGQSQAMRAAAELMFCVRARLSAVPYKPQL
jgi:hypothetical protein